MAHAGLIQKYHCELLRKDTNSLASYFNSPTRELVVVRHRQRESDWLSSPAAPLPQERPAASASSPCRKRLTSVPPQKTADVSRPIPVHKFSGFALLVRSQDIDLL